MAFVLPKEEVGKVSSLPLFLQSPAAANLEFIRGVTLSMEVPTVEVEHVSSLKHAQISP